MSFVTDSVLKSKQKQAGNDTNRFDNEIASIFDKLLEYKSITPSQHTKKLNQISTYVTF